RSTSRRIFIALLSSHPADRAKNTARQSFTSKFHSARIRRPGTKRDCDRKSAPANRRTDMPEANRELVIVVTHGADHELSSVAFTIANGGITAGLKVSIFLTSAA